MKTLVTGGNGQVGHDYPRTGKRPAYFVLSNEKLEQTSALTGPDGGVRWFYIGSVHE
jgi:dTDP-4-dehydrorhamnose reductase